MKQDSFEFDRQLHDLLCQDIHREFTTHQLRDAYAALLPPSSFRLADVRIYVYEQIRRLIRAGWVEMAEQRQKRGQVFRLLEMPQRLKLVLVDGCFPKSTGLVDVLADEGQERSRPSSSSMEEQDDQTRLQAMLKEARLDLLSSMGETERYKQLFEEIPHLKGRLEAEYLEVRDRSSKLIGHLRAIENALKAISAV
ncbi:hypothetical protein [Pseudomonas chlororaphis]|uniref:Response regulator n=1 Tax=Pseudomonas chlororaphis TaxID=587753 RepID=A0AAX3FXZ2_9PSED|nr:hypothetical protein [Pseudomonas chlororaphis]AZC39859.1 hypothetical protein C4K37_5496 [Pseudomonas chlororaphis subsp. piscium]AZC46416.1 hypothetical protein C4K36_5515 [Pseudomonas chlororaphis subsp. piscium]AZC59406.1 hypothetical protein C4K34_5265 [Pseudomonas chlororaphis subsp. piscium]WDG71923.1 hypothetical protein PUP65_28130 [Pseudomonas chlororaphis]WDH30293.1 hypothetical protein PUP81_06190 [Pseudomonas chlororaphis]